MPMSRLKMGYAFIPLDQNRMLTVAEELATSENEMLDRHRQDHLLSTCKRNQ